MPETFLTPVIDKLVDLLFEEAKSLKGVHKQVKSVKDELEIIEPFLRDAEAKSERGLVSDATKVWLKQLRDEADRIEDVVDDYVYHLRYRRSQTGFLGALRKGGRWITSLKPRHEIASEIRDVKESLRDIKDRGVSYGLRPFEQGSSSTTGALLDPRIGSLFVDNDELVVIDPLSKELVKCLVEGESKRTMISLVGEGGIGKTTLARKVYNDAKEKGWFDHHVWVTVSQPYDIHRILKILVNKVCPSSQEFIDVEEAFTLLRDSLQTRRYVIVFDDVWQIDFWSVISNALPNNDNGSRILVTTRNSTVVDSLRQIPCEMIVQKLKSWSTKQSWELFCRKTFSCSEIGSCCYEELEQLSREIVSKCEGLPLAIVAIAGLLSQKEKSKLEWKRVLSNLDHEFEEHRQLSSVSKVLLLSYHDLPYYLKSCFLYFGVFPEDTSLYGERLCRMWIAEGFIKPTKDKVLEQIAEEYLIELISRNLVSFELRYGAYRFCKVHDLIHRMILRRNDDLNLCNLVKKDTPSFNDKSRRLSIYGTAKNTVKVVGDSKIRSVVLHSIDKSINSFLVGMLKNSKLVKVLVIEESPLGKVPKRVGTLLHLTYLSLNTTKVKILPKSIGKLRNLQTLDVRYTLVRELPIQINKLRKLRHILAGAFDEEGEYSVASFIGVRVHKGIGRLEELQSLDSIEANPRKELENLRELKRLGISKVTEEMGKSLGQSIDEMNRLEELFISSVSEQEVLNLNCISSPPLLLRSLQSVCRLQQLPSWLSELQNLTSLELNFSRLVEDPLQRLGGLPNLAFLRLYEAYDGKEMHVEGGGFQKLRLLVLGKLRGLEAVRIERGAMPLLEKLEIGPVTEDMLCDINRLTSLKTLGIFDMPRDFVTALQQNRGSECCKIHHITNLTTGRGRNYNSYKLGRSKLLQHSCK